MYKFTIPIARQVDFLWGQWGQSCPNFTENSGISRMGNAENWENHGKIMGKHHLGVSENSVPLNTMVNDHYPY